MDDNWPTKLIDLQIAERIMQTYTDPKDTLGLVEVVVNLEKKQMNYSISQWVRALAKHFYELYGSTQGDFVTRKVLGFCLRSGEVLH